MFDIVCLNRVHWNSLTNGIGVMLKFVNESFGASQVFEYLVLFAQHSDFHKKVAPPAGDVEAVDIKCAVLTLGVVICFLTSVWD